LAAGRPPNLEANAGARPGKIVTVLDLAKHKKTARSEAIRRLIEIALTAKTKRQSNRVEN